LHRPSSSPSWLPQHAATSNLWCSAQPPLSSRLPIATMPITVHSGYPLRRTNFLHVNFLILIKVSTFQSSSIFLLQHFSPQPQAHTSTVATTGLTVGTPPSSIFATIFGHPPIKRIALFVFTLLPSFLFLHIINLQGFVSFFEWMWA